MSIDVISNYLLVPNSVDINELTNCDSSTSIFESFRTTSRQSSFSSEVVPLLKRNVIPLDPRVQNETTKTGLIIAGIAIPTFLAVALAFLLIAFL